MIYCEILPVHEAFDVIRGNIGQHYIDACENNEYAPVDIDWNYHKSLGEFGKCFAVLLKKNDKTIGYSLYTLSNDPLRKELVEADNICIYVKKKFRGISTMRLIKKSHEFMKALGAKQVNYALKNKTMHRMLEKIGGINECPLWSVSV
jgi:hypothetical protein